MGLKISWVRSVRTLIRNFKFEAYLRGKSSSDEAMVFHPNEVIIHEEMLIR
jgi:hypothetical protein